MRKAGHIKNCFTILELLIVIAIITILSSLLFPALRKAKDNAKSVLCNSNLKQVGVCLLGYTQTYNDYYPFAIMSGDEYPIWAGKIAIDSDLKNLDIFICPSVKRDKIDPELLSRTKTIQQKAKSYCNYISYGMSRYGLSNSEWLPDYLKVVKSTWVPSDMLVAVDFERYGYPYDGYYISWWSRIYDSTDEGTPPEASSSPLSQRHGGRLNVLHSDGHSLSYAIKDLKTAPSGSAGSSSAKKPWYEFVYQKNINK